MEELQKKNKKTEEIKGQGKRASKATARKKTEGTKPIAKEKTLKESETKKAVKTVKEEPSKKTTKAAKKDTENKVTKNIKKEPAKKTVKENSDKKEAKKVKTVKESKEVKEETLKTTKKVKEEKAPKTEKSKQEKKTKKIKDETAEKNKKTIDISIGAIICVLVILALVLINVKLGMHAYNVIQKDNNENANTNTVVENDTNTSQEIGHVLNANSDIVKNIIEKITYSPNVTASIYNAKQINKETMANDLKLKIGWEKTPEESKLKSINENNESVIALKPDVMWMTIKQIFGQDIEYSNQSFDNGEIGIFSVNHNKITYANGLYTTIENQEGEGISPLIYQEVQKIVKYSEKVEVHVKTIYLNVENDKYVAYKDFSNGEFKENLLEITQADLLGDNRVDTTTGEGTISIVMNNKLDNIREKMNSYKYIFEIDSNTQEYYFSEFCQE